MIILALLILIPLAFFMEAGFVYWFLWALHDTGYVDQAATFSSSCVIALPIFFATALGAFGSSRS